MADYRTPMTFTWIVTVWLVGIALMCGFWGTVGYVLWHFVSKFW